MSFRQETRDRLDRLSEKKAEEWEMRIVRESLRALRSEFDALVKSLGLTIKDIPAHKEVSK